MEIKKASLVLADISGYTKFVREHRTSLLHAEQIITDLLEAVIDTAEYPLTLNKLEGDAALLFTPVQGDDAAVARDVTQQVLRFFQAFRQKQRALIKAGEGGCPCEACVNIDRLQLKAFLHQGEVVVKRVRQFEELAGENVILIHRLLKNSLSAREYLLMTDMFYKLSGGLDDLLSEAHVENYEDLGEIETVVFYPPPDSVPLVVPDTKPMSRPGGIMEAMRLKVKHYFTNLTKGQREFRHL